MSADRAPSPHAAPAWLWASVLGVACRGQPGPAHREAVTVALDEAAATAEPPDAVAGRARASAEAVSRLASLLHAKARQVVDAVFGSGQPVSRALETPLGPGMCWDVLFAGELARTGPRGEELAGNVRAAAVERLVAVGGEEGLAADSVALARADCRAWELWCQRDASSPPRWLRLLARALWVDVWRGAVRPEIDEGVERDRRRGMYNEIAVIPLAVAGGVLAGGMDARRTARPLSDGHQLGLFLPGDARPVASVDLDLYSELADKVSGGRVRPSADALLTFAIREGFRRWREMPADGLAFNQLLIEGGRRGLAARLGVNERDAGYALDWGRLLHFERIDLRGLWLWDGQYQRAAPGRPAAGLLTLQTRLLPHAEQGETGRGRYWIPWTEPPAPPANHARRGPATVFWRMVTFAMGEQAAAGRLRGRRAVLPETALDAIARRAGEPDWRRLRDYWIKVQALDVVGDGWMFGPLYAADQRVIDGSGGLHGRRAKGGRARAAKANRARRGRFNAD